MGCGCTGVAECSGVLDAWCVVRTVLPAFQCHTHPAFCGLMRGCTCKELPTRSFTAFGRHPVLVLLS